MEYPTTFSSELRPLQTLALDKIGRQAVSALATKDDGYEVAVGARRVDTADLARIAFQEGVLEYCLNDSAVRVGNEEMTAGFLEGGVQFFLLRHQAATVGYGWLEPQKHRLLPGWETTFAIRLDEAVAGRRLAVPFGNAIVSGWMSLGMRNIWLGVYESNIKAWHAYEHSGALLKATLAGTRPTQRPIAGPPGSKTPDIRRLMVFPWTFVDKP
jgi:hypothetical protein